MNTNDRRSDEALSLRAFFDDQLTHLHNLTSNLGSFFQDAKQQTAEDKQIVESFVDASNSKMRAVHGYSHKLRDHVRALYSHVLQVADEIPPPVDLNLEAFRLNPLINALFASGSDIDKLFLTNSDIHAYFQSHSQFQVPVVYALLTANKSEKNILGVGRVGDMLIREVPQQVVNFSAHKIHTPCANLEELTSALRSFLFDRVVVLVKQEMVAHRLDESSKATYESQVNSVANPDVYLDTLLGHIKIPASLLNIDKIHFKLSKLGIKLDDNKQESANEFDIHELIWGNNTRNVVLQIVHVRND